MSMELPLLDPRETKRRRRMAVSVVVSEEDGPDSPQNFFRHLAVSSPNLNAQEKIDHLSALCKKHPLFACHGQECTERVYMEMVYETFRPDEFLFKKGDNNNKFYVIVKGTCAVYDDQGKETGVKEAGDFLGDLSLVQAANKKQTVRAKEEVAAWTIEGALFLYLIHANEHTVYDGLKSFIELELNWLGITTQSELMAMLDGSSFVEMKCGDVIVSPEKTLDSVYFVKEGDVEITTPSSKQFLVKKGEVIGVEILDVPDKPVPYTAVCKSEYCVLVAVKPNVFDVVKHGKETIIAFRKRCVSPSFL